MRGASGGNQVTKVTMKKLHSHLRRFDRPATSLSLGAKRLLRFGRRIVMSVNFLALFAGSLVVLDVCQETPAFAAEAFPLIEKRPLPAAIREFNHLHSKDAKGREQRPLSKSELIACLLWKMSAGVSGAADE